MITKFNSQTWLGVIWLFGSLFFLQEALEYSYFVDDKPGAGFFPIWLCSIMAFFSVVQIIQSFKASNGKTAIIPKGEQRKSIAIVFGAMILFILLAPYLGFTIACTLFMGGLFYYNGYRLHYSLGAGLVVAILLFSLFYSFLGVAFPVNDFGW